VLLESECCALAHIQPTCIRLLSLRVPMFPAVFTRGLVRGLDWLAAHVLPAPSGPLRHRTGRLGEEHAYFYLRSLGYLIVARNYRSPRCRGEIDLIGWDQNMLCFIEVKTRTSREIKPPEAAVDYHKRREVALVAREYLRSMPESCQWRFDIVSVYCDGHNARPQFELFRNASLAA
jgi:putative endonuclease